MEIEPIGYIKSCYPDKFGVPRQSQLVKQALGKLTILPKFQPEFSLEGLAEFSHVWLIFKFHLNDAGPFRAKVHPPRLSGQSRGVFATRSPHRPNQLGLSLVNIEKIDGCTLYLGGIDLVDGTPVFDIKPYLPEIECQQDARAEWIEKVEHLDIEVEWTDEARLSLEKWSAKLCKENLKELIESTLRLDPRPLVYRGFEGHSVSKYRAHHAVRFFDGDVHFYFVNQKQIRIERVFHDLSSLEVY